jgi:hypothetical protein
MKFKFFSWCALMLVCAWHTQINAQGKDLIPRSEQQVIETLAQRAVRKPQSPEQAVQAAQQAITLARQTSEARYLGRAQALLQPWWDKPDAPTDVAVLQATVQQGRHEFAAARAVLSRVLAREPGHAQGWITMATLERVAANYPAAARACAALAQAGAVLYAAACSLETQSLQGDYLGAQRGLEAQRKLSSDAGVQAWLWSLAGENEERAGHDDKAFKAYTTSLALAPDNYTALAMADLLLRTQKPAAALPWLAQQPASEAVLLRKAYAYKLLQDPQWKALAKNLQERFVALEQRGDAPVLHARERALAYLWLDQNGQLALQSALLNLSLQKEPFDWWLALASAQLAGDGQQARLIAADAAKTGLRDVRLSSLPKVVTP